MANLHNFGLNLETLSLIGVVTFGLLNKGGVIEVDDPSILMGIASLFLIGFSLTHIYPDSDKEALSVRFFRVLCVNRLTLRLYNAVRRTYQTEQYSDIGSLRNTAIIGIVCICLSMFFSGALLLSNMDILDKVFGFLLMFALGIVSIIMEIAVIDEILDRIKKE